MAYRTVSKNRSPSPTVMPTKATYVFPKEDRFKNETPVNAMGSYEIKSCFDKKKSPPPGKSFGSQSKRFEFLGVGLSDFPNQSPEGQNYYTTNKVGVMGKSKSSDIRDLKNKTV